MSAQTGNTKTIDWNNVVRITLRATWWILKMLFKLVLIIGSAAIAIFVFLFDRDDEEDDINASEPISNVYARRYAGLKSGDRQRLDNSIYSDEDY
jgi:hypothetical protein